MMRMMISQQGLEEQFIEANDRLNRSKEVVNMDAKK